MPWNVVAPDGTKSVKQNQPILQENTTYITTTMGPDPVGTNAVTTLDHFWNVSATVDGRHRFIQSPKFTVGGIAADAVLGTGMDGVMYYKEVNTDVARTEMFYRNIDEIYQLSPSFKQGTITPTTSFQNMVVVPKNVYGEIFMFMDAIDSQNCGQIGYFESNDTNCRAWAISLFIGSSAGDFNLEFGNGNSDISGLNIRVRRQLASAGILWQYRVIYRAK